MKKFEDGLKFKLSALIFIIGILAYGFEIKSEFFIKDNYNIYFGKDRFKDKSYFGGSYEENKNDNNYTFFSVSGINFIVINLGWQPNIKEIEWADKLLKTYSKHKAIIVSHFILTNYEKSFSSQGKKIYEILKYNPNVFLMLSGHEEGQFYRTDVYKNKNGKKETISRIHSLLSVFTGRDGGNGWLQLLIFSPKKNLIQVKTYIPFLKEWERDENSEYTLPFIINDEYLFTDENSEDFTIIVLPDTQVYSKKFPHIYTNQTQWIVDNYEKLNIAYVAHVGDVVDDQASKKEWINADKAMMVIENAISKKFPNGIPYGIAPGNHDLILKPNITQRIINVLKLTILKIKLYPIIFK